MISPSWSYCLSYKLELRKEAIRLCKEQSFGIQSALWSALRNTEHRMKHWLQLVAIPNAPSSSSNQELQSLKKRISDLEKARSRAASGPQMLALLAPSAPAQGQKGGKGRKRGGFGRYAAKSQATNFDYLMKLPLEFRANFHEKFHKNEICYKFQKNSCTRSDKCKFSHVCVWGAAVRSLTTTADASPRKSTEPHHRFSLKKFQQFLLPCPFPRLLPL